MVSVEVLESEQSKAFVFTDDLKKTLIAEVIKTKDGWEKLVTSIKSSDDLNKAKRECYRMFDLVFPSSHVAELCKDNLDRMLGH